MGTESHAVQPDPLADPRVRETVGFFEAMDRGDQSAMRLHQLRLWRYGLAVDVRPGNGERKGA